MSHTGHPMRLLLAALLTLGAGVARAGEPPRPGYVLPDGSLAIVGNDGMETLLSRLNDLVARSHPGLRFTMTLKGSSTALPALAADATLVAPLAREAWRGELAGFRQIHGHDPTAIRIGYSGWGPRANGKTPPAVYVNAQSPLTAISLADLGRLFGSGAKGGDINLWSQLGVGGEAGQRRVHLYGLRDEGGSATAFRTRFMRGLAYAPRYEPLDGNEAVIRAVAADPYGIGITGWVDAARISDKVRILAIAQDGAPALPSRSDVAAGRYPLAPPVQLVVNMAKDAPLPPLVRAYLQAALSDEGQAIIAAEADGREGYLPLSPADLATERAKLDRL